MTKKKAVITKKKAPAKKPINKVANASMKKPTKLDALIDRAKIASQRAGAAKGALDVAERELEASILKRLGASETSRKLTSEDAAAWERVRVEAAANLKP